MEKDFSTRKRQRITWPWVAGLVLLTLLAYSSVIFAGGFIWDDDSYVTENMTLRTPEGLADIWLRPGATPQYYPLVFTVFWLEYHAWGLNPHGYHVVNVLLHVASALLLWMILLRLDIPSARWAAFLFALHPVHVESVAWVTELKNVLSGCFYLGSLLLYLSMWKSRQTKGCSTKKIGGLYVLSLLLFVSALLSKSVTATLPAVILLLFWWKNGRFSWREVLWLLPFFVAAVAFGLQTVLLEKYHVGAAGQEWRFSFIEKILIASSAIWFYFQKLLWPYPLVFTYPRVDISAGQIGLYFFPLSLAGVLWLLWKRQAQWGRGPLTGVLSFIGTLFPALGFFNVYPHRFAFVADHFQYLASIGILVLAVNLGHHWFTKKGWLSKPPEKGVYAVVLLILGLLTWRQALTYQNSIAVFSDVIRKNPSSWMAYNNRAVEYISRGWFDLASQDVATALKLKPDYPECLNNRGLLYSEDKNYQKAYEDFSLAIEADPRMTVFYENRANAAVFLGWTDAALRDFNRVIEMKPQYDKGYLSRGTFYSRLGNDALALEDFEKVLEFNPHRVEAYMERSMVYYRKAKFDLALRDLNKILQMLPHHKETLLRRAAVYQAMGEESLAVKDLVAAGVGSAGQFRPKVGATPVSASSVEGKHAI